MLVQPSTRRAYSIAEYKLNGAVIQEDISEAHAIFGVKIIPPELIIPNKRYAFFSHTIKAQPENMNVLDALLAKVSEIIRYKDKCPRECHNKWSILILPQLYSVEYLKVLGACNVCGFNILLIMKLIPNHIVIM